MISNVIGSNNNNISNNKFKFLILIPAYREGETLLYTIDAIKHLNYPKELFSVIILNDLCDKDVISKIKDDTKVVNLDFRVHSKVQSLKFAIPYLNDFDFVIILDADNLIHPEFLNKINQCAKPNSIVIQGLRYPKRLHTITEQLDAITDFVYNHFDRIIPSKVGLTGTLSGSGFAIRTDIFAELISEINTIGGFDKFLQSELVLRNIPVHICPNAIVFDEKVKDSSFYVKQRRRWFYFHFYNSFKYAFKLLSKGLCHLNFNQVHLGLVSLRPPISLLYVLTLILLTLAFLINTSFALLLLSIIIIYSLIIFKILKERKILSFKLILAIPLILFNQIKGVIKIFEAKKDSLKTDHYSKEKIEEIIFKENTKS